MGTFFAARDGIWWLFSRKVGTFFFITVVLRFNLINICRNLLLVGLAPPLKCKLFGGDRGWYAISNTMRVTYMPMRLGCQGCWLIQVGVFLLQRFCR